MNPPSRANPPPARWVRAGQSLALVAGSLLFCALVLEVALRVEPELLGQRAANQLFSRYTTKPGGLYFREDTTDMFFMHPNQATRAYFNGYVWDHASDARGFRNPPGRPVDGTLLLGDSLIYGHGVEEEESLAGQLESRYGSDVYNLSRQGDCLYQHYVMLRLHLEAFEPETVVLFVFHNDFDDLLAYRGLDLLDRAPEIARNDYAALRRELEMRESNPHSWSRRLRYHALTYRLFLALRSRIQRMPERSAGATAEAETNPLDRPLVDPDTRAVMSRYYDRILGDLAERVDVVGATLVVVHLDAYPASTPETAESKAHVRELLASATARHGIALFDTGELIHACECTLPGDGHLTAEGHARLADFLHASLGGAL
jgi:hypothetical protein